MLTVNKNPVHLAVNVQHGVKGHLVPAALIAFLEEKEKNHGSLKLSIEPYGNKETILMSYHFYEVNYL